MNLPAKVYAIYTLDKNGNTFGVYVGASHRVEERIKRHLHCHTTQIELHDLMRKGLYKVQILDSINEREEACKEYEWIRFFQEKTDLKVFNVKTNCFLKEVSA
jgi:hypothetical protein